MNAALPVRPRWLVAVMVLFGTTAWCPPRWGAAAEPRSRPEQVPAGEDLGTGGGAGTPLLAAIEQRMRDVEQRLRRQDVAAETQAVQQRIVQDLDGAIEQLRKQRQMQAAAVGQAAKSGTPPGGPPDKPGAKTGQEAARGSADPTGQTSGTQADAMAAERALGHLWGHLPERLRRQLQSGQQVEFLPRYQQLIQDYYRRLAEQPAGRR